MKERGFAPIYFLILIAIVTLAFWISKNNQNNNLLSKPSANTPTPTTTDKYTPPSYTPNPPEIPSFSELDKSSWKEYKNFSGIYSFKLPSDWFYSEYPLVDKYHLKGNALIQNKSFTEIPKDWKYGYIPPTDLVFGDIFLDQHHNNRGKAVTEDEFYTSSSYYHGWLGGNGNWYYEHQAKVITVAENKFVQRITFPLSSYRIGIYGHENKNPKLVELIYTKLLEGDEKESDIFNFDFRFSLDNPGWKEEVNKFHNVLQTLKTNSQK